MARDGFVVRELETGRELGFIPCSHDGRMREKVETGLILRIDSERSYVEDTREADRGE